MDAYEWIVIPKLYDRGNKDGVCLCTGKKERFVFKATRSIDNSHALIGLRSASKFRIRGIDIGFEAAWIDQEKVSLKTDAKLRRLKGTISYIQKTLPRYDYRGIWGAVNQGNTFSPRQFYFLAHCIDQLGIPFSNDLMNLNLSSFSNKDNISRLPNEKIDLILKYLNTRQSKIVQNIREEGK